ncbi:MAG: hypothetical protein NXI31_11345 [bacterium]|nr:hypothetical protein [bacterium]
MRKASRNLLLFGALAGLVTATIANVGPSWATTQNDAAACTGCNCLAPEVCGDHEKVCPAGVGCWMPEYCADQTVVCPPSDRATRPSDE